MGSSDLGIGRKGRTERATPIGVCGSDATLARSICIPNKTSTQHLEPWNRYKSLKLVKYNSANKKPSRYQHPRLQPAEVRGVAPASPPELCFFFFFFLRFFLGLASVSPRMMGGPYRFRTGGGLDAGLGIASALAMGCFSSPSSLSDSSAPRVGLE